MWFYWLINLDEGLCKIACWWVGVDHKTLHGKVWNHIPACISSVCGHFNVLCVFYEIHKEKFGFCCFFYI